MPGIQCFHCLNENIRIVRITAEFTNLPSVMPSWVAGTWARRACTRTRHVKRTQNPIVCSPGVPISVPRCATLEEVSGRGYHRASECEGSIADSDARVTPLWPCNLIALVGQSHWPLKSSTLAILCDVCLVPCAGSCAMCPCSSLRCYSEGPKFAGKLQKPSDSLREARTSLRARRPPVWRR